MTKTMNFPLKHGIVIAHKKRPARGYRIIDIYDNGSCSLKEVNGDDWIWTDVDTVTKEWQRFKKPKKKVEVPKSKLDNFGNKILIGDRVYFVTSDHNGRGFRIEQGTIEGFTERNVIIDGYYIKADKIGKMITSRTHKE